MVVGVSQEEAAVAAMEGTQVTTATAQLTVTAKRRPVNADMLGSLLGEQPAPTGLNDDRGAGLLISNLLGP
jgi:hypothetical protein